MRCIVTGGTGHVGSFLIRKLLSKGHAIDLILRPESDVWRIEDVASDCSLHVCDLSDVRRLESVLIAARPEIVFHLAWDGVAGEERNSPKQVSVNVPNTLSLLEAAGRAGCKTFVGLGSQAEYGIHEGRLEERQVARPETIYGVAKHSLCLLARKYCELVYMRYLWLRLFSTYGPKDHPNHMLPTLIEVLLDGRCPALTPGEQQWDYLYVEDAADAIYQTALSEASGIFNIASGFTQLLRQTVECVRDMIDPALPLGFGEVPYRPDQVMHLEGSIDRIMEETGWSPKTPLKEGLERTVVWHKGRRVAKQVSGVNRN